MISDVMMPVLNGLDLQRNLTGLHPGLRTIFMSGYTAAAIDVESVLNEDTVYLAKPFTSTALLERAAHLLEQTDRARAACDASLEPRSPAAEST